MRVPHLLPCSLGPLAFGAGGPIGEPCILEIPNKAQAQAYASSHRVLIASLLCIGEQASWASRMLSLGILFPSPLSSSLSPFPSDKPHRGQSSPFDLDLILVVKNTISGASLPGQKA